MAGKQRVKLFAHLRLTRVPLQPRNWSRRSRVPNVRRDRAQSKAHRRYQAVVTIHKIVPTVRTSFESNRRWWLKRPPAAAMGTGTAGCPPWREHLESICFRPDASLRLREVPGEAWNDGGNSNVSTHGHVQKLDSDSASLSIWPDQATTP